MIPNDESYDELDEELALDFEVEADPSLTYAMNFSVSEEEDNTFVGRVDEEDAVRQAILKILNTERYESEIYSWDYGVELQDLFGQSMIYCMSEVKDRVTEALLADDRIESVDDFTVERVGKRALHVSFTVTTEQGEEIDMESEVDV